MEILRKIKLDSEKILPIEDRIKWNKEPEPTDTNYMINILFWKYHKALEAAELKNIQLQQNADERYNKALEIFDKDTNNITFQFEQYLLSPEEFEKYLKIAAYEED